MGSTPPLDLTDVSLFSSENGADSGLPDLNDTPLLSPNGEEVDPSTLTDTPDVPVSSLLRNNPNFREDSYQGTPVETPFIPQLEIDPTQEVNLLGGEIDTEADESFLVDQNGNEIDQTTQTVGLDSQEAPDVSHTKNAIVYNNDFEYMQARASFAGDSVKIGFKSYEILLDDSIKTTEGAKKLLDKLNTEEFLATQLAIQAYEKGHDLNFLTKGGAIVSEAGGSSVDTLLEAGFLSAGASSVGGAAAAPFIFAGTVGLNTAQSTAGLVFKDAIDRGNSLEDAKDLALVTGAITGSIESFGLEVGLGKIASRITTKGMIKNVSAKLVQDKPARLALQRILASAGSGVATGAGSGATEESLQEFTEQFLTELDKRGVSIQDIAKNPTLLASEGFKPNKDGTTAFGLALEQGIIAGGTGAIGGAGLGTLTGGTSQALVETSTGNLPPLNPKKGGVTLDANGNVIGLTGGIEQTDTLTTLTTPATGTGESIQGAVQKAELDAQLDAGSLTNLEEGGTLQVDSKTGAVTVVPKDSEVITARAVRKEGESLVKQAEVILNANDAIEQKAQELEDSGELKALKADKQLVEQNIETLKADLETATQAGKGTKRIQNKIATQVEALARTNELIQGNEQNIKNLKTEEKQIDSRIAEINQELKAINEKKTNTKSSKQNARKKIKGLKAEAEKIESRQAEVILERELAVIKQAVIPEQVKQGLTTSTTTKQDLNNLVTFAKNKLESTAKTSKRLGVNEERAQAGAVLDALITEVQRLGIAKDKAHIFVKRLGSIRTLDALIKKLPSFKEQIDKKVFEAERRLLAKAVTKEIKKLKKLKTGKGKKVQTAKISPEASKLGEVYALAFQPPETKGGIEAQIRLEQIAGLEADTPRGRLAQQFLDHPLDSNASILKALQDFKKVVADGRSEIEQKIEARKQKQEDVADSLAEGIIAGRKDRDTSRGTKPKNEMLGVLQSILDTGDRYFNVAIRSFETYIDNITDRGKAGIAKLFKLEEAVTKKSALDIQWGRTWEAGIRNILNLNPVKYSLWKTDSLVVRESKPFLNPDGVLSTTEIAKTEMIVLLAQMKSTDTHAGIEAMGLTLESTHGEKSTEAVFKKSLTKRELALIDFVFSYNRNYFNEAIKPFIAKQYFTEIQQVESYINTDRDTSGAVLSDKALVELEARNNVSSDGKLSNQPFFRTGKPSSSITRVENKLPLKLQSLDMAVLGQVQRWNNAIAYIPPVALMDSVFRNGKVVKAMKEKLHPSTLKYGKRFADSLLDRNASQQDAVHRAMNNVRGKLVVAAIGGNSHSALAQTSSFILTAPQVGYNPAKIVSGMKKASTNENNFWGNILSHPRIQKRIGNFDVDASAITNGFQESGTGLAVGGRLLTDNPAIAKTLMIMTTVSDGATLLSSAAPVYYDQISKGKTEAEATDIAVRAALDTQQNLEKPALSLWQSSDRFLQRTLVTFGSGVIQLNRLVDSSTTKAMRATAEAIREPNKTKRGKLLVKAYSNLIAEVSLYHVYPAVAYTLASTGTIGKYKLASALTLGVAASAPMVGGILQGIFNFMLIAFGADPEEVKDEFQGGVLSAGIVVDTFEEINTAYAKALKQTGGEFGKDDEPIIDEEFFIGALMNMGFQAETSSDLSEQTSNNLSALATLANPLFKALLGAPTHQLSRVWENFVNEVEPLDQYLQRSEKNIENREFNQDEFNDTFGAVYFRDLTKDLENFGKLSTSPYSRTFTPKEIDSTQKK